MVWDFTDFLHNSNKSLSYDEAAAKGALLRILGTIGIVKSTARQGKC